MLNETPLVDAEETPNMTRAQNSSVPRTILHISKNYIVTTYSMVNVGPMAL